MCGIRGSAHPNENGTTEEVFPIIVGYEVWNYLAFILLPVLYVVIRCKLKRTVSVSIVCKALKGIGVSIYALQLCGIVRHISPAIIYRCLCLQSVHADLAFDLFATTILSPSFLRFKAIH